MGRDGQDQLLIPDPAFAGERSAKEKGPLQPERPLSRAACASALLLVVAVLVGALAALLAVLATLLLLLLFATLFLVALLLLVGVLVSHFLSPHVTSGARDEKPTLWKGRALPRDRLFSLGRGGAATNVISLRQLPRL